MEESVLLGTKPLVDSIRHFIRDPSGVFSVCHLCECRIVQWRQDSRLLLLLNWFLHSLHIIKRASLTREILFLPLKHKIHIFSPPCNILYLSCTSLILSAKHFSQHNVMSAFFSGISWIKFKLPFSSLGPQIGHWQGPYFTVRTSNSVYVFYLKSFHIHLWQ